VYKGRRAIISSGCPRSGYNMEENMEIEMPEEDDNFSMEVRP
jgi:hypothetical protein